MQARGWWCLATNILCQIVREPIAKQQMGAAAKTVSHAPWRTQQLQLETTPVASKEVLIARDQAEAIGSQQPACPIHP